MRVVILGKGEMLSNLILGTIEAGCEIVGVFRYENIVLSPLKLFLHDNFAPSPELVLIKEKKLFDIRQKTANSPEFKSLLLKLNPDVVLVGTWCEKLKKEIFDIPRLGTVNVHPSFLPRYRGPNPYLQTIWHREKFSGVTFHLMSERFDEGAILLQEKISVTNGDTGKELRLKTCRKARQLVGDLLSKMADGAIVPTPQDVKLATYFPDVIPEDMTLNFKKETAEEILAHIRAFYPFRPTYIQDGNMFWIVNPYRVFEISGKTAPAGTIVGKNIFKRRLEISCYDEKILVFKKLKPYTRLFKFY